MWFALLVISASILLSSSFDTTSIRVKNHDVTVYNDITFGGKKLLGQKPHSAQTIEECIEYCMDFGKPILKCRAVNFKKPLCWYLDSGITHDGETNIEKHPKWAGFKHAYIQGRTGGKSKEEPMQPMSSAVAVPPPNMESQLPSPFSTEAQPPPQRPLKPAGPMPWPTPPPPPPPLRPSSKIAAALPLPPPPPLPPQPSSKNAGPMPWPLPPQPRLSSPTELAPPTALQAADAAPAAGPAAATNVSPDAAPDAAPDVPPDSAPNSASDTTPAAPQSAPTSPHSAPSPASVSSRPPLPFEAPKPKILQLNHCTAVVYQNLQYEPSGKPGDLVLREEKNWTTGLRACAQACIAYEVGAYKCRGINYKGSECVLLSRSCLAGVAKCNYNPGYTHAIIECWGQ